MMKKHLRYSLLLLLSIAFSSISQAQTDPVLVNGINYELNDETNRYNDPSFRVSVPVRLPCGAHLYIKGWLPCQPFAALIYYHA